MDGKKQVEPQPTLKQKEKLSTKISRYTFLLLLVLVVVKVILYPSEAEELKSVLDNLVELNIYTFIGVLVGAGAINKIAEMFNQYRGKR
jgi:hypothetical protein